MLDIKFVRENPEIVSSNPTKRVMVSFLLSFAITEFKPLEAITVQTSVPVSPLFNPAAAPTLFNVLWLMVA